MLHSRIDGPEQEDIRAKVFLTPLVISFMFIHEMTGSLISSYFGLHQIIWETIRVGVVVILLAVRLRTYREEL